jgi:hypothetical protein
MGDYFAKSITMSMPDVKFRTGVFDEGDTPDPRSVVTYNPRLP